MKPMKPLSRPRQLFLYGAPFPALAFFKIWASLEPSTGSLTFVSLLLWGYSLLIILIARNWDQPTYFDWVIGGYFSLVSFFLVLFPGFSGPILSRYAVTGIYACFFTAAFFPSFLGLDPFTTHYAKKSTPRDFWENPIFIGINRIMTHVWSGIFAVCLLLSLYPSVVTQAFIPLGLILGFGLPFNLRFPDLYLKKKGLPTLDEQRRLAAEEATIGRQDPSSIPLPESAWEAVSRMPGFFNPEAAGSLDAVIGFIISGAENFEANLIIQAGTCRLENLAARPPDLLIRASAEVWLAITRRELDGQEAFFQKAYQVEGDLGLLIRMKVLFSGGGVVPIRGRPNEKNELPGELAHLPEQKTQTITYTKRKEPFMKVLALNSSPRSEGQSQTEFLLKHLVEGMQEAGAEVEVVALRKKSIKYCIGCFTCWTKTPGVCIHQDDMTKELFPKWLAADVVIYATPLYHYTVNAQMKAFVERTLPVLQPFFDPRNGETRHPLRQELPRAVVLSVAGFPERSVFDQLSSWAQFIFGRNNSLVAELYCPAAQVLAFPEFKEQARKFLEAFRQAGREIVERKAVSEDTMAQVNQDIVEDKEALAKIINLFWKTCIAEEVSPREFEEQGLMPRPDSVETFLMIMSMGFNPEGAGDTKAIIQFNFSGEAAGSGYFRIENGRIESQLGSAEKADLTIEAPFEVWMDIVTGKADGQRMFMEQKYKVNGDLSLLMRMNQFFGKKEVL
jgi:multimeric flavodoxin WrbA/putative sterol carrier protein